MNDHIPGPLPPARRRPNGRPKTNAGRVRVSIYLSPSEAEELRRLADRQRRSLVAEAALAIERHVQANREG